jgi:hypothetical protein
MTGQPEQHPVSTQGTPATVPTLPTLPPGIPTGDEAGYNPLSLFALGALVLAAAYALTVAVGVLISLLNHTPLLLPLWTLLIPVGTALCCGFARYRIQTSEGTLSGLPLTTWGLGLSLLFGLGYAAYYTATFLAIRNQAQDSVQKWLQELREGHTEKAFWLTVPPSARTEGRQELEIQFNTPAATGNPTNRGPYSNFVSADFVRLLTLGGDQTTTRFDGVEEWGWEKDGFLVKLRYQVTTPYATFPLIVATHGMDSRSRDKPGRQWTILMPSSQTDGQPRFTEEGETLMKQGRSSSEFTQIWVQAVNRDGLANGYLLTLPVDERVRQVRIARRFGLLAVAGFGALLDNESRAFTDGLLKYQQGNLVQADSPTFWADATQREAIISAVKKLFDPQHNEKPLELRPLQVMIPDVRREGDDVCVRQDIRLTLKRGPNDPPFLVDASLVLVENPNDRKAGWRVKAIELVRGRTAAPAGGPGQRPTPLPPPQ